MKSPTRILLAGLAALAFLLPSALPTSGAGSPGPSAVKALGSAQGVQIQEWTYPSDGLRVKGRLYLPSAKGGRLPVVVFNHDGISGISKEHNLSSLRLARAGFVVFSPSYRGEDGSEGEVEIAKGEVRDVLNVIPLLGSVPSADADRVAFVGASHGALISLLAAARYPKVKAVVSAYGVADIYRWWDYLKKAGKLGNDAITRRTYGDGPEARPQSFALRNAMDQVAAIRAPVLILQGEKDDIVPPEQARLLKEGLDRAGVPGRLCLYPDALHGFLVYAPYLKNVDPREKAQTEQAWTVMLGFLREHLGAPRS